MVRVLSIALVTGSFCVIYHKLRQTPMAPQIMRNYYFFQNIQLMSVQRKSRKVSRTIPEVPEGYSPYARTANSKAFLASGKYRSIVATLNNWTG